MLKQKISPQLVVSISVLLMVLQLKSQESLNMKVVGCHMQLILFLLMAYLTIGLISLWQTFTAS